MSYGKDFGLTGILAEREIIPVKYTDKPLATPNEQLVQTISFLMDNMRTRNRRDGDYRAANKGVPTLYRYTHPELASADTSTLVSVLNMISQPARPSDWEDLVEHAVVTNTPAFPLPWTTEPIYGNPVFPGDGESQAQKQMAVLRLTCASKLPADRDLTSLRSSMDRLESRLYGFPDAPATAGPMIVSAVREIASLDGSNPNNNVYDQICTITDRIRIETELYCTGGAKELPFALRFTGEGLDAVWNRWNGENEAERAEDLKRAILNRRALFPGQYDQTPFREIMTTFPPESETDWRICSKAYEEYTVQQTIAANQNRYVPNTTFLYRVPESEEARAEAMKTPFRMDWGGAENGITRMYINREGFACERHASDGTNTLVLENSDMYRKGMDDGFGKVVVLGSGLCGIPTKNAKELELQDIVVLNPDMKRIVQEWWTAKREEFKAAGRTAFAIMPDDERAVLVKGLKDEIKTAVPEQDRSESKQANSETRRTNRMYRSFI